MSGNMRAKGLALGALLAGAMSCPAWAETAIPADNIRVSGRAEKTKDGWITSWTGTSWRARFTGTGIGVVTKGENFYAVLIDGREMAPIAPGASQITSWYRDLSPGAHEIEVIRRSGQTHHRDLFAGFVVEGAGAGAGALPMPAARPGRMLVIGDSSMTGYGTLSDTTKCDPDKVTATTDFTRSHPYKIATILEYDWEAAAAPAAGLTVNCCGEQKLPSLAERYFNMMPPKDERPTPNLILLGLGGTNSWVRDRQPEMWAAAGGDAGFVANYLGLIKALRGQFGPTPLILAMTPLRDDPVAAGLVQQAAEKAQDSGDRNILFMNLKNEEPGRGCNSHMDPAQNEAIAVKVLTGLKAKGFSAQ